MKLRLVSTTVRIPSNVPLDRAPWDSYAQALADLVSPGASPRIETTLSNKASNRD